MFKDCFDAKTRNTTVIFQKFREIWDQEFGIGETTETAAEQFSIK